MWLKTRAFQVSGKVYLRAVSLRVGAMHHQPNTRAETTGHFGPRVWDFWHATLFSKQSLPSSQHLQSTLAAAHSSSPSENKNTVTLWWRVIQTGTGRRKLLRRLQDDELWKSWNREAWVWREVCMRGLRLMHLFFIFIKNIMEYHVSTLIYLFILIL